MTIEELVRRDTDRQCLPVQISDPDTLARIAAIVASGTSAKKSRPDRLQRTERRMEEADASAASRYPEG